MMDIPYYALDISDKNIEKLQSNPPAHERMYDEYLWEIHQLPSGNSLVTWWKFIKAGACAQGDVHREGGQL